MSKYLITYIDESQEDRDAFEIYFDEYNSEFDIKCIPPGGKTINELIEEIIDLNPDMVVLDYDLKYSDDTVSDNGDVIMQRISDRKPLLPVALLTSFMSRAKSSFLPPEKRNSVLDKGEINDSSNPEFRNNILSYVKYYQKLLKKYKIELAELTQKENRSDEENARVMELDIILEGAVDRQAAIKSEHKTDEKLKELHELINSTKALLNDFKSGADE